MGAAIQCKGPVHHFLRFRPRQVASASTPAGGSLGNEVQVAGVETLFLGTAVGTPEVESTPLNVPYQSSAGGLAPAQLFYAGETHTVYSTLNYYDEAVWRRLRAWTKTEFGVGFAAPPIGSPLLRVHDFELVLVYGLLYKENGGTGSPDPTTAVPTGRRYYSVTLAGSRESDPNRAREVALAFYCVPYRKSAASATGTATKSVNSRVLYTEEHTELGTGLALSGAPAGGFILPSF